MPKPSSRFRTRKINFKSAIPVYVGSFELPFDDDAYFLENAGSYGASPGPSGSGSHAGGSSGGGPSNSNGLPTSENGDAIRVETGVDKEEEREHHLQAAISASAAALQRGTGLGRSASGGGSGANGTSGGAGAAAKAAIFNIPTPDATGTVADYESLYAKGAYTDPHSYNRSSETVEETMGIAYTMDEEDEDWLEDYNNDAAAAAAAAATATAASKDKEKASLSANMNSVDQEMDEENRPPTSASKPQSPAINGHTSTSTTSSIIAATHTSSFLAKNGHYPPLGALSAFKASSRKHKQAIRDPIDPPLHITEDDFELVMDILERATDEKYPTLHSDVSRMPALEALDDGFLDLLPGHLLKAAKALAKVIYPHWRTRRLAAGGKNIVPQLDQDMTAESPYVCFRRREVKVARKTRRTDTQTIDKLVRLKSDLNSAQELFAKVLERERSKREGAIVEGKILEQRIRARTLKRKLGEAHGDEALLVSRRERRRKSGNLAPSSATSNKILIPNRTALAGLAPGLMPDPLPPYKDKTVHAAQRIEKDMQRKREQEFGWEDMTDTAYLPAQLAIQSRFWAAPERLYRYAAADTSRKPTEVITFDQNPPAFTGGGQRFGPRYRKRVGRGGRIHLDRLHARWVSPDSSPSSSSSSEGENQEDEEEDLDDDAEQKARRLTLKEARRAASRSQKRDSLERLRERWRYDADIPQEIPSFRHPAIVDDFESKYTTARCSLLAQADWESVLPALSHVEEAMRWTMREPDRLPPMQIIGKLPGQRIQPFSPVMNQQNQQQHQIQQQQQQQQQQGGPMQMQMQGQQQQQPMQGLPMHGRSGSIGLSSPQMQAQQMQMQQMQQQQMAQQMQQMQQQQAAQQQAQQMQQQAQQMQQQQQQQLLLQQQQQQQQGGHSIQGQGQGLPSPMSGTPSAGSGMALPQQPQIRRLMYESGGA